MEEAVPQWATALLSQINHLNSVVMELQDHTKEDSTVPRSSSTEPSSGSLDTKPTKHLGPLATYDGNREQLEPWISQAEAKLHVDYAMCSNATQFFMIHNQLRGEASRQLQPWVQAIANTEHMTAQALLDQLRLSFGDPHVKEKAKRKLHRLKQASRPFGEYFTEYRKLVLEAGGTYWPDEIKKSYLEAGLSLELQQSMIGRSTKDESFEQYCSQLKQASDQLEAFNLRNKGFLRGNSGWRNGTQHQLDSAHKMDWEPTKTLQTNRATTETNGRRATWVSQETVAYRREKNLCLRCGNQGHMVKDCKFLPARRPLVANKAATSDPSRALPEAEDSNDESEK